MFDYNRLLLDKTDFSQDIINITCDYIYDLEKNDEIVKINRIFDKSKYETSGMNTSITVNEDSKNSRSFNFLFCDNCGKYYRTTVITIKNNVIGFFRYSHFNSFLLGTNNNDDVVVNNYVIEYDRADLHWTNFLCTRIPCKHVSCSCNSLL